MQIYHRLQGLEEEDKGRKVEQEIERENQGRGERTDDHAHGDDMKGLKRLEPRCVCKMMCRCEQEEMRLCAQTTRAHVGVSGSGQWCTHRAVPRNHECCHWCPCHGVPRNHRCCHWHPRCALSPSHRQFWVFSTFLNFPLLVPILNLLSCCSNSSSLFPVAILCTLLHRENMS